MIFKDVCFDEYAMGLRLVRRYLLWKAQGKVLEIAAGTGTNLKYYRQGKISDLVVVDYSPEMINVLVEKDSASQIVSNALVMDAGNLEFADQSFDTVVDTFGLCSFEDPVKVLKEMKRVVKNDGRILLLEHGKSSYEWLQQRMDSNLFKHVWKWGCYWNRDILKLLDQAELEIEQCHRIHFGTTFIIIARPKSE
jgi:methyltransferase OMS1